MEITINATIPDNIAAAIQNGSTTPLPRRLLELAAIKAHEANLITEREVMEMLGLEDHEELYDFFKRYDVRSKYTAEDIEREGEALEEMLAKKDR
ncbi:MAG: UPF0175 family protein [Acidobacteria bacterium]|nr:UPF0175 family protein [Acidobacteriota bacterium]